MHPRIRAELSERTARVGARVIAVLLFSSSAPCQEVLWDLDNGQGYGSTSDEFGWSVAGIGDVTGDGVPDVLVGALYGDSGGIGTGEAYVFDGQSGTILWSDTGHGEVAHFGQDVAGIGDVDADGVSDVLVTAPRAAMNDRGEVYVYSGSTGVRLLTLFQGSTSEFGTSIAALPDVNSDGTPDVAVGMPWSAAGRAYVMSGADGSVIWKRNGSSTYECLGTSCCSALGDLSGDGIVDVWFGGSEFAAAHNLRGVVKLLSGADGSVLMTLTGETDGSWFGSSIAGINDVDGDGFVDVLIGSMGYPNGSFRGRIYLISGKSGLTIWTNDGLANGDAFGVEATVANVDGDGDRECIFSADSSIASAGGGRVDVLEAATGRRMYSWIGGGGANHSELLGNGISCAGDLDGDGCDEVIVGAPTNSRVWSYSGRVYVFRGSPLWLDVSPKYADVGDSIELTLSSGKPTGLAAAFLVDVSGTPAWVPCVLGTFDVQGFLTLTGVVPAGLSGMTLSFLAFGEDDVAAKVVASATETLNVR